VALHTSLLQREEKQAIRLVTIQDKVTLNIRTGINILGIILMESDREKANMSMLMGTDTRAILRVITSMELENWLIRIRASIMVYIILFRSMGKWGQAWRRYVRIRQ